MGFGTGSKQQKAGRKRLNLLGHDYAGRKLIASAALTISHIKHHTL